MILFILVYGILLLLFFGLPIELYCGLSYGIMLLGKKYEPQIHPALSWIPIVNLYPLAKISGRSGWWMASFFAMPLALIPGLSILALIVPLVNIFALFYISSWIAKRVWYGYGCMFLLIFLSPLTLPWLWLKANGRKTTIVWIIGSIVCVSLIGAIIYGLHPDVLKDVFS